MSYSPDVFGLNRRTIESLKAQERQARFALVATHITLSSNIALAAIQEASLRGQIDSTNELISISKKILEILRSQLAKGYASELDVAAQEAQLAQTVATLPPLLKQLAQQRDLLAELSGGFPNQELPEKFELSSLHLPRELPLTLPSQLVEQRPDVRQAEENLHSASALIGVARANRLPNFTLTADAGSMAVIFSHMFAKGGFWDVGGGLTQPVFDGGTLLHRERAARAAYTQADEQYRSTVLTAFQNVADTLHAIQQDADGLKAASAAKDAAAVTLDLTKKQLDAGYANYLALLSAEQAYQQALLNLVQAQSNRLCRHCRAISSFRRRLVEPPGFAEELSRNRLDKGQPENRQPAEELSRSRIQSAGLGSSLCACHSHEPCSELCRDHLGRFHCGLPGPSGQNLGIGKTGEVGSCEEDCVLAVVSGFRDSSLSWRHTLRCRWPRFLKLPSLRLTPCCVQPSRILPRRGRTRFFRWCH